MTNIEKNDPRLTAFVLGELSEAETREIQAALEADQELKAEFEAIRQTVAEIEAVMQNEPMPEPMPQQNISVAQKVDQPKEPKEAKKRRFPLTIVELLVVVSIIGMLAGLLMPTKQAARECGRRARSLNEARQTEMDAEASNFAADEAKPIEDAPLRYGQPSDALHEHVRGTEFTPGKAAGGRPGLIPQMNRPLIDPQTDGKAEQHSGFVESLMESEKSFIPVPEESAPAAAAVDACEAPARESDRRFVRFKSSEKKDDLNFNGHTISGSGELKKTGDGSLTLHGVHDYSGQTKLYGGSVVGGVQAESVPVPKQSIVGRQKRLDVAAGQAPARPAPSLGVASQPVPVSPYFQNGDHLYFEGKPSEELALASKSPEADASGSMKEKQDQSVMLMVAPRIVEQEAEEEDFVGEKIYPIKDLVVNDPYNSANDETYKNFVENEFLKPQNAPFSTFSIDVDSAAYTTMRRYVEMGRRPPVDSVRLEEYVNYFKYDYDQPQDDKPFATHVDVAACPWNAKHLLARIGIKGKEYGNNPGVDERPPLNLVFLIDTSGSMESSNRLPLVKRGLTELVEMLQPKDRVAIVTYAGSSRVALPSVSGQEKQAILDSINSLGAGGSTAGAAGIKTAYETARKYYDKAAQNRVILCTDGDFNVGETNNKTLETMIGEEAKSGVFLTILGFGMGNYKDERLKTLSMRGNGNYGYVDSIEEARRLLVEGLTGTLFAIAKDVKIQVDFNPERVAGYRLLGYENRKLRDEDFHNDKIDAGEIGAGHTVTALYEIVPVGETVPAKVDESRYAEKSADVQPGSSADAAHPAPKDDSALDSKSHELMFVKLRYKKPDEDKSSLLEYPVVFDAESEQTLSGDAQFAAAVALYGMLLRNSRYSGDGTFDGVLELAEPNTKDDKYRKEFVGLVKKAKSLTK